MGGGLLQIVAYGAQDVYLTGNAHITFWKVVYRRHTNFSMEAVSHTLNGNPDFGRECNVEVLRNGDLVKDMCLRVVLKAVDISEAIGDRCADDVGKVAYIRRLGHALVKEVECDIGGSKMDKHYGVWMDILYELTHTTAKERGYRAMIGDVEALTKLRSVDITENGTAPPELPAYTLYIPLQFWFNTNPGLALPLIALQYHQVRLNFKFEQTRNLVVWSGSTPPDFRQFGIQNASLLCNYIYLDAAERMRFAHVGHEYLIQQLQFTGEETFSNPNTKLRLGFSHPCKELIWAVRNGAFNGSNTKTGGNRFLAYTHEDALWDNSSNTDALQEAADNLARGLVWVNNTEVPSGVDSESVEIPAVGETTTTTLNFSDGSTLRVTLVVSSFPDTSTSGSGPSGDGSGSLSSVLVVKDGLYTSTTQHLGVNKIQEITISIDLTADSTVDCYGARADAHTLTLADISVPTNSYEFDYRSTTPSSGLNPYDVSVVQLNYGLRLDGAGNPVVKALIQLNGHNRFEELDGNYFNYVQPEQHHTRTPCDGVNVYSFALHPEQHQPSGTANLSRIDNTQLCLTMGDSIRSDSDMALDLYDGSILYVYAVNYNVARCLSGMIGIAYAN